MSRVKELANIILKANEAYYNDQPTLTDNEFDALKDELVELDPDNNALYEVGSPVESSNWVKTKHEIPMGSQDKVNTMDELRAWESKRIGTDSEVFSIQEKLDGISLSLNYKNGKLVSAVTRGNGLVGENIFKNALKMKGVPVNLEESFTGSIRGEVLLFKNVWEEKYPDFSNPRNAASGMARRMSGGGQEDLTVICYDVASNKQFKTEADKLGMLTELGFIVPNTLHGSMKDTAKMYKLYAESRREELLYEIDGLVIKVNNVGRQQALGNNGTESTGNPKGQVALKFAHEMRKSKLVKVTWEVGLTGRITPVAHIEPVKIAGVIVGKASLSNIDNVKKLAVRIGSEILVSRRNDVIPFLEQKLSEGDEDIIIPTNCPQCDSVLERNGAYLECLSGDCRIEGNINKWIKYMEIENVGPKTVMALVEAELVTSPADLYCLEVEDVMGLDRMGEKSAQRVIDGIQDKAQAPLWLFLGSLNIPNCGRRVFKNIVKEGYSLEDILQLTPEDLERIDGIGARKAEDVCAGMEDKAAMIEDLLTVGFKIIDESAALTGCLDGKSFCFTGKMQGSRKELEKAVKGQGGCIKSVSGELDYLVIVDPQSSSSKAIKARKLGVQLISEKDFLKMVG